MSVEITHEFVVDESKWCRGGKNGTSFLLNERGCMCCLGFYGESRGVSRGAMFETAFPDYIGLSDWPRHDPLFKATIGDGDSAIGAITYTNDTSTLTDDERKAELAEQFASIGVRVKFVPGAANV